MFPTIAFAPLTHLQFSGEFTLLDKHHAENVFDTLLLYDRNLIIALQYHSPSYEVFYLFPTCLVNNSCLVPLLIADQYVDCLQIVSALIRSMNKYTSAI